MATRKKAKIGLPKKVFVYWYEDDDEPWLNVFGKLEDCADRDKRLVGTYQLVEVQEVSLVTMSKIVRKEVR